METHAHQVMASGPIPEQPPINHMREPGQRMPIAGMTRLKRDRKSTRLNSSHLVISYAVFCLKKKKVAILLLYSTLSMIKRLVIFNISLETSTVFGFLGEARLTPRGSPFAWTILTTTAVTWLA